MLRLYNLYFPLKWLKNGDFECPLVSCCYLWMDQLSHNSGHFAHEGGHIFHAGRQSRHQVVFLGGDEKKQPARGLQRNINLMSYHLKFYAMNLFFWL